MSTKSVFSAQSTGVVITDPNRLLGIASFVVAFFFPIVAWPMAVVALRRSKVLGDDNFWARLGRNISIFVLVVYVVTIAIGLTIAVIIPLIRRG